MPRPSGTLKVSGTFLQAEPLWKRVPTRDENGNLLADFLMLIPGLARRPQSDVETRIACLHQVLHSYRSVVVYADLNLKLGALWVSLKPVPGKSLELATAIKFHVPEAVLVAQQQQ